MAIAGVLSGLLGIGSGAFKVLAMDRAMGLPFKVSTSTSNFMIGVTAVASAGVYLALGYIEPGVTNAQSIDSRSCSTKMDNVNINCNSLYLGIF